jgi:hypothetical protein
MTSSADDRTAWFDALLATCLLGVVVLVGGYLFNEFRFWFQSDDATRTVLADLAVAEGRFLPRDWVYANGDLPILSAYTVGVLLWPVVHGSLFANTLAAFISYLFLLTSFGAFCHAAFGNRRTTLLSTILVASGLSLANLEFLIALGGYSVYLAMALCLLGLVVASERAGGTGGPSATTLAALVAGLLCAANPLRSVALVFIPLGGAWAAARILVPWREPRATPAAPLVPPLLVATAAGALVGTGVYFGLLLPAVVNYNAVARPGLAPLASCLAHLAALPSAWLAYFSPLGDAAPATGVERLLSSASQVAAIWLAGGVVLGALQSRRGERAERLVACFAATCLACPLLALSLSRSLEPRFLGVRYAILGLLLAIPVTIHAVERMLGRTPWALALGEVGLATFSLVVAWNWRQQGGVPGARQVAYEERQGLIRDLQARHIHTALTSYWNSHVLTVLSGSTIHAHPIRVDPGMCPFPQFSYRGLDAEPGQGRAAIMLADSEAKGVTWDLARARFGPPLDVFRSGQFVIFVYPTDVVRELTDLTARLDHRIPAERVSVAIDRKVLPVCTADGGCVVELRVRNRGDVALIPLGNAPIRFGVQALDSLGNVVDWDVARADLTRPLAPGASDLVHVRLPAGGAPRVDHYRVCLLQEGIAWLCDRTRLLQEAP